MLVDENVCEPLGLGDEPVTPFDEAQSFQRSLAVNEGYDYGSRPRSLGSVHDEQIPVIDPGTGHRSSFDTHDVARSRVFDEPSTQVDRLLHVVLSRGRETGRRMNEKERYLARDEFEWDVVKPHSINGAIQRHDDGAIPVSR
nr:hypothetical protein [Sphingomonas sp. Leaf230]